MGLDSLNGLTMALVAFTTTIGQDVYSGSTSLVVIDSEWEDEVPVPRHHRLRAEDCR